ncbi:MAG: ribonucleoside-diphosphate reductase, adenosylcobalamin-dependent, partial [Thermoprotei archaeon]
MTNIVKLVVVKSDGSEERFSIDKLRTSLDRAVRHAIKGGDSDIVNEVLDEVVLDISKSVQGGKIKTAEIAERVEKVLISKVIENLVYERIARAYVLARIYNHVYGKGGWSSFDPVDEDLTYAALRVLQARYLLKDSHSGRIKETPKMMFWRVASGIARAEKGDNFEVWRRKF